jgi:hypothetical protein
MTLRAEERVRLFHPLNAEERVLRLPSRSGVKLPVPRQRAQGVRATESTPATRRGGRANTDMLGGRADAVIVG